MKRHHILGLACLLAALQVTFAQSDNAQLRDALRNAGASAIASLVAADCSSGQTIALLPLGNDTSAILAGTLKAELSSHSLNCVEAKQDPFFDEIMKQIEWNERKEDILDAKTITTFGKLQAGKLLLYGWVRQAEVSNRHAYAEIELHLSSIATNQHLWGGTFIGRTYLDQGVEGIISLDEYSRENLRSVFEAAKNSLAASSKTNKIKRVAIVPLAGDIDRYASILAEGMFSTLPSISPANVAVNTLAEAIELLRAKPETADAILYGAVRDLSTYLVKEDALRGDTYRYNAEVQLRIQTPDGEILWSDSKAASVDVHDSRTIIEESTNWVIKLLNKIANNPIGLLKILGGIVILLAILSTFRMFLRSVSRPR